MMFENKKTFQHFMSLLNEFDNEDERAQFSLNVHRRYDSKVTGEKQLKVYKITIGDLDVLFQRMPVHA